VSLVPSRTRVLDVGIAVLGLIVLAPVIFTSFVAIRLTSRGPGVYRQVRIGRGRQPFVMYKLRTMRYDPDDVFVRCISNRDDRITPVGRFLRQFRIDELPQLVNVLLGQMSLVGPRPFPPALVAEFDATMPGWDCRFRDRPGLTSYGTLKGRTDADRLRFDAERVGDRTLRSYFTVLAMTAVFLTGPSRWRRKHRLEYPGGATALIEATAA
jgi:lipopolysaccharide/colanic/teichoic acid biosynthesis glycosyltransferase